MTLDQQQVAPYFQVHGLAAQPPSALNEALREAIDSLHQTLYAPSNSELTAPEAALLENAGADLDDHPARSDPLLEYATEFGAILATSLRVAEAAKRLGGVTAVRVRQLIADRTLFALRSGGRWKIPVFQFHDAGLVPNIGIVNAALSPTIDAVSVLRWYRTPDPELATPNGALCPLDWLKLGMDPGAVAKIARDL